MAEPRRVGLIDFRNTGVWVAVLLILLVVLNAAAFLVYRASHSAEGLSLQLWNYAESDTAKLIAASLIFPLAIFLVEGRFNVVENVRASRVERARQAQDARRTARLETISETSRVLNDLFQLTTVVSSPGAKLDYADLRSKIWNMPIVFTDVQNGWRVRFPNLAAESGFFGSYALLANVLIESAASALFHIQAAQSEDERADVSGSLDLIAGGITMPLSYAVTDILNASLELLEIQESSGVDELSLVGTDAEADALLAKHNEAIRKNIENIDGWAAFVAGHVAEREPLAAAQGPAADDFRREFLELASAMRDDPGLDLGDDPRWGQMQDTFLAIPRADRLLAWNVKYSNEWLARLADGLIFVEFQADLSDPNVAPNA